MLTILHLGEMLRFGLEPIAFDAFYVSVFKSLRFYLSTLEGKPFQKDAFSNEYELVWMGPMSAESETSI